MAHSRLSLPSSIVTPADLGRLKRELDRFNDEQRQAELRAKKTGKAEAVQPGRTVSELAALNDSDLTKAPQRTTLLEQLETTIKNAPVITISFAVDPPSSVMAKIVDWLRQNIDPGILVRVGLQPNIAAGCVLRTPSKLYDFGLRRKLDSKRSLLLEGIRAAGASEKAAA